MERLFMINESIQPVKTYKIVSVLKVKMQGRQI